VRVSPSPMCPGPVKRVVVTPVANATPGMVCPGMVCKLCPVRVLFPILCTFGVANANGVPVSACKRGTWRMSSVRISAVGRVGGGGGMALCLMGEKGEERGQIGEGVGIMGGT